MKRTTLSLSKRLIRKGIAALALLTLSVLPAHAASLTWNSSVTTGAWDLATSNWATGGSPTAWTQTSTTSALNQAVFGGADGTYTVSLSGTGIAAQSLYFNASGYTITGGTLSLPATAAATGTNTVAAGKTATINSFILGPNNAQVKMDLNGVLNLGGGMNNPQWITAGSGTLNITGGTYDPSITTFNHAVTKQTGGVLKFDRGSTSAGYFIANNAGRNTNYTISSGTLSVNSTGAGAYLGIGRNSSGYTSTMSIQGDSVVNIGTVASRYGQLNIVSNDGLTNGLLDIQGGTLNVGTNLFSGSNRIYFSPSGLNAGKTSTWQQSGGTVNAQGIQFGLSTTASYSATASAKLLFTGGNIYVGGQGITQASGSAATLPVTIALGGGTLGALADWSSSLNMGLTGSNGNVTIQAATASGTAKNITLSGILSGTGGFSKTGSGALTLSGSNTYSGATVINNGILAVDHANALGDTGDITFGGGTLQHTANNTSDYGSRIKSSGSAVTIDTNGQNVSYGAIDSTNTGGLTKIGTGMLTLTGINGYTGLTTISSGTLALGSGAVVAATTAGPTISNGSVLQIGNGAVFNSSGLMRVTGTSSIVIDDGGTMNANQAGGIVQFLADSTSGSTNAGVLAGSGTGSMMNVTSAFLRLAGVNNSRYTFTMDNVLVSATNSTFEVGRGGSYNAVSLSNGAVVKAGSAVVSIDANNYTLNVNSGASLVLNNGNFTLKAGGGGNGTTVNIDGGSITGVNAVTFNSAPNSSINITNGGLLSSKASTISGSNALVSVSGAGSHWTLNNSTLGIGVTSGLGETVQVVDGGKITASGVSMASGSTNFIFDNGTLAASANNATLLSSNGTVSVKNGGAILDSGAFNVTVSAPLTEDATSTGGGLTKIGTGTVTMSSNGSSFTGATNVNFGKMIVSGSLAGTTTVNVASGATLTVNGGINALSTATISGTLNGSGVLGAVSVANGGVLAPGNSAGVITMASLAGTTGAKLSIELGKTTTGTAPVAGTHYDQVSTDSVLLNDMTLDLVATAGTTNVEAGDMFFLIINSGLDAIGGTFEGKAQDSTFTFNGMEYQISYTADSVSSGMTGGNDVALLAVPEPSTYAFLLGGLGLLFQFQRLRKQRVGTR